MSTAVKRTPAYKICTKISKSRAYNVVAKPGIQLLVVVRAGLYISISEFDLYFVPDTLKDK